MNLGDKLSLEVIDYDHTGRGLGKADGAVVFLDGGFIGDRVLVEITKNKKRFYEGRILEYIERSKDRVKNPCPYGEICGGCSFLGWSYQGELEWKRNHIQNLMERIAGLDLEVDPVVSMEKPRAYRNHMQFHQVGKGFGLYDKASQNIVPIRSCLMQKDKANRFLEAIEGQAFLRDFDKLGLRTNSKDQLMAIFVSQKPLKESNLHKLVAAAIDLGVDSLYFNQNKNPKYHYGKDFRLLFGQEYLEEDLGGYTYKIGPSSFFQVNKTQAQVLVDGVKASLGQKEWDLVFDLFCGVGTLTLPLSEKTKETIGVEINPKAIDDAREIGKANDRPQVRYIAGRVEKILPRLLEEEGLAPDFIVLDPPRAGVEKEALEAILESRPERITYVSCNPSTLARDLKILKEAYKVDRITPVDMFPRTAHVECVVLMSRVEK